MGRAKQPAGGSAKQERYELSAVARRGADRIERLPKEVVASFVASEPKVRASRLGEFTNRILVEITPVITWLERRRHPGTAELVKRLLRHVLHEAVACAGADISEYAGGTIHRTKGEGSAGAERNATMLVTAKLFAYSLREWAEEIESEGTQGPAAVTAASQVVDQAGGQGQGEGSGDATTRTAGEPKAGEGNGGKPQSKRRKTRKKRSALKADKQLYCAWKTGYYKTQAALAQEKGITEREAKLAIDRHRKRESAKEQARKKPRQ